MQRTLLSVLVWLSLAFGASAGEVMPAKPARWFNDYAGVVPANAAADLDAKLRQFELDTSNQIVVAVWRDLQSDTSVQDYTFRIFQQWKLGQSGKDNGIGLFVFINPRTMFMQVGYGLEGAVPDAVAKRIIEDEIGPHFKTGDYAAGLAAGVDAVLAAAKGEYKGTDHTMGKANGVSWSVWLMIAVVALTVLAGLNKLMSRGVEISGRGWRWLNFFDLVLTLFRSSSGGISFGGGGGGSSGGGGFSGGGGRSGGGGAGGGW